MSCHASRSGGWARRRTSPERSSSSPPTRRASSPARSSRSTAAGPRSRRLAKGDGMAVRWGIISTARINRLVLAGAALSAEVEVVAVASRDLTKAESYAREHGIERAHGSYEELLEDADVDAVYISLPNALHVEWATRALEAGKHVLCEKPLGRRAADVEALFDTAEASDRFLMEAFMWRHNPQTKRLQELVEEGAVGDLRLVRAAFSFPLTDLGN